MRKFPGGRANAALRDYFLVMLDRRKYLMLLLVIGLWQGLWAQRDWTWVFGDSVVMRFPGGGAPVVDSLASSVGFFEMGSCISDTLGNLWMYSHRDSSYNRLRVSIPGGEIFASDESITQGVILIEDRYRRNAVHIFNLSFGCGSIYCLLHTLLDFDDDLLGATVVGTKQRIIVQTSPYGVAEKLACNYNANGKSIWAVTHLRNSGEFIIASIEGDSVASARNQQIGSVYQNIGNNPFYSIGEMTFSRTGDRLAAVTETGIIDVFDFDRCTGELSNWRELGIWSLFNPGAYNFYGCEFSPDGRMLYVLENANPAGDRLYQFDLSTATGFSDGAVVATLPPGVMGGQMQLGPDGKIYITHVNANDPSDSSNYALSVLNQPNWFGGQFSYASLSLKGKETTFHLPNIPNFDLGPSIAQTAEAGPDRLICAGDSVLLGHPDTTSGRVGFWWSGPGLSDPHNAQSWAKPDSTAWYFLQAMDSVYGRQCGWTWDSVLVVVDSGKLTVDSLPDEVLACEGDTVGLGAWGLGLGWDYQWSGGGWIGSPDSVATLVAGAGDYVVTAVNPAGIGICFTVMDTVRVLDYPWAAPADAAGLDVVICNRDSLRLGQGAWVTGQDWVYNWWPSAGLDSGDIARPLAWPGVTTAYVLVAGDTAFSGACAEVLDTVLITVEEPFTHAVPEDTTFCPGECFLIGVPPTVGYQYLWSPTVGLTSPTASMTRAQPSTTATYTLTVTNPALQSANCRERRFPVTVTADDCHFQSFIAVNGDNIAEALDLGDHAGKVELKVYDVAGRLVHADEDYGNDWSATGLAHGVYVYRVNIHGECPVSYSGKVVVVR